MKRKSQNRRVAEFLNTGAPLTPMSAQINLNGVTRLASRIHDINTWLEAGEFPRLTKTTKSFRDPEGTVHRYSSYSGNVPPLVINCL